MKLNNIKIKVETDEENQYVLKQHMKLNEECAWVVYLVNGRGDHWNSHTTATNRAVCSVWKGFRHLAINSTGDLILCSFEKYYDKRKENEITFEEFKAMCEPKKTLWDKRLCIMHSGDYTQKDVKEALKELEQFFKTNEDSEDYDRSLMLTATRLKIKEIFGEELV